MRYRVVATSMGYENDIAETDELDDALIAARNRRDWQERQIREHGGFTPGEGVRVYDGDHVIWSYKWPFGEGAR